jgi:hypothetical protein
MSQPEAYHLSMTPQYLPDRNTPETVTGQVAFAAAASERVVCRVEVRAAWEEGGEVEVSEPEPPTLPGLSAEEIKERARRFTAQFRDDGVQGRRDPDAEDRELESFQASES